ncbi:hypothetical protein B0H17DRAFT_1053001 [Mycena rosella]|uniref:Cytochrome b561 domain-containing protein n=1 Tax=Mycena rosella TaxID=1033263 RepID=A0AAD7DQF0_MYCRO|nr:hypothetical protein B0H17DRAFT_1053001 [Mycena rosella]
MPKTPPGVIDYHDQMIIAHAVFASVATLITAPAAILVGRYFRSQRWWFNTHLTLQTLTAFSSSRSVSSGGNGDQLTGPKADPHHDIGLAIIVLFLLQFLLGVVAHFTHSAGPSSSDSAFPTLTTPKSPLRHLHVIFGIVMTALLYAGVKTGMDEWDMVSDMATLVPKGIVVVYWVIFGLEPIRASGRKDSIDAGSSEKVQG